MSNEQEFQIEELHNEEFYGLFAPDGSIQMMTLAPDFATCVAQIRLMHSYGMGQSYHELVKVRGFKILPVAITMVANGTENKPFQEMHN